MRSRQPANPKDDSQISGKTFSDLTRLDPILRCVWKKTKLKMSPLANRGLRKSGGKGKKYDKEATRASLDSR